MKAWLFMLLRLLQRGTCKTCRKKYTHWCRMRIWGRQGINEGKHLDIDLNKDYCSRWLGYKIRKEVISNE